MPPHRPRWDVFLSHSHTDEAMAIRLAEALRTCGLRVFRAADDVDTFSSISSAVLQGLADSSILVAYYSPDYATRPACQHEFATAYLAGQAEGDPLGRVLAINSERTFAHIEPRQLRDALLPTPPVSAAGMAAVAEAIAAKAKGHTRRIGEAQLRQPIWVNGSPVHPPAEFTGRWAQLWWLHSALHPDLSPLTSPPTPPIVVLHGTLGIGKTALAAEYVRRFGGSFPAGVVWYDQREQAGPPANPNEGSGLYVIDNASGDPDTIRHCLPTAPGARCLVLARDPRLAELGNAHELTDLSKPDTQYLFRRHISAGEAGHAVDQVRTATDGSPHAKARFASLADEHGLDAALHRLPTSTVDALGHLQQRLEQPLRTTDDYGWDILRVLVAASPATVSIPRLADILATVRRSDRVTEIAPVQRAVLTLFGSGLLSGTVDAASVALSAALRLAIQRLDPDQARAEHLRSLTMHTLTVREIDPPSLPATRPRQFYDDEERRAAHRVQTELLNRITGHPLPPGEGSLREAISSLHTLLQITRTTRASLHPAAARASTTTRPGFGTLAERLVNDVLRGTLTHWHNELSAHEDQRPAHISRIEHERAWEQHDDLRDELAALRTHALDIATELSIITGNPLGLPDTTT
ncbi:toll/interleukin-1 receptor domain-containing protein [Tamaricihabitans halophyticus]|nr:toll/interleukin-1 receptor domain-containing protein [Tamaricihabitans halophyticus]